MLAWVMNMGFAASRSSAPPPPVQISNPGQPAGGHRDGWSPKFEFSKRILESKEYDFDEKIEQNSEIIQKQERKELPILAKQALVDLLSKLEDDPEDEEVIAFVLAHEDEVISKVILSVYRGLQ